MDNKDIEAYIKAHRKEFDLKMPSDELWSRIDSELDKEKKKNALRFPFWLSIAASLLLLMGVVFIYNYHRTNKHQDVADINPGYAKKEVRFANMIEEKKDSLQVYADKNPALYATFSADLNKLDVDYHQLKKELRYSPNQRMVARAMIKNLELQLQVISQQLSIISEVNEYKEENQL